uniref:Putative secreted protein n=1 Tax=Ixodes ricinus TaxID=34613 RepID=A0A6B0UGY5_IXORI
MQAGFKDLVRFYLFFFFFFSRAYFIRMYVTHCVATLRRKTKVYPGRASNAGLPPRFSRIRPMAVRGVLILKTSDNSSQNTSFFHAVVGRAI